MQSHGCKSKLLQQIPIYPYIAVAIMQACNVSCLMIMVGLHQLGSRHPIASCKQADRVPVGSEELISHLQQSKGYIHM